MTAAESDSPTSRVTSSAEPHVCDHPPPCLTAPGYPPHRTDWKERPSSTTDLDERPWTRPWVPIPGTATKSSTGGSWHQRRAGVGERGSRFGDRRGHRCRHRSGDIIVVRDDLGDVVDSLGLAKAILATIKGNMVWAFGYNIAAIRIAAAGLLNPLLAGAAMAFSSFFVVSNSLRLRRYPATS